MSENVSNITAIACSIFRDEIESLRRDNKIAVPVIYLDSMLHMFPSRLHERLDKVIKAELESGKKIILIYGECSPYMDLYNKDKNIKRIGGINCVNIFLDDRIYKALRKEGAFFLIHEWALRWKEIFQNELGLNAENAKSFMSEMHTKLIYLDTGSAAVPVDILNEISAYCGLAYEITKVTLDVFSTRVNAAVEELKK
jgi:hypothetical protein